MMRILKFIVLSIFLGVFAYFFQNGRNEIPPLGKFLDPFEGFWQNAEKPTPELKSQLNFEELKASVTVVYDNRLVPHIFAQNDEDAYFAQGYITAQHRLWQMEFQTHFAAGRISEIVGEKAIMLDRMQRRNGMAYAAEQALAAFEQDPVTNMILTSYTAGINAYISQLSYKNYPLEYKLLNYKPEPWSKLKSTLLLKYMADMLTGTSYDLELTNAYKLLGESQFNFLYPDQPDTLVDPVIPTGTSFTKSISKIDTGNLRIDDALFTHQTEKQPEGIGSNNWAVNGAKTQSGAPILCNDPHLSINLPSIWYEIQITTPEYSVYGASLPGAPAVIIGFNNFIAWGVTNGTQDVKDYYKMKFKTPNRYDAYWFDSTWKETTVRIEQIFVKGQSNPVIDSVFYTHFGPIVFSDSLVEDPLARNLAMRWTGHDPSNELLTFFYLNRGKNYADYEKAIQHFQCPGQNFIFASASGDIAIWQQGKFPLKYPNQGKMVMDGTASVYQWQGFIPQPENPHILNPTRNFVSSANQHPTDGTYPYYYNGRFEHYRNRRINNQLAQMQEITVEDMKKLQNDNFNLQAAESLPFMLKAVQADSAAKAVYFNMLKNWDFMNAPNAQAPVLYEIWFTLFYKSIWDEWNALKTTLLPQEFTTITLMQKAPQHVIFDIQNTNETESAFSLLKQSFSAMCDSVQKLKSQQPSFTWSGFKNSSALHLSRLPALSVFGLPIGGNNRIVNASGPRSGPSWRMIVSLEKPIKAYGIYPGGQSGNPGSHFYTNQLMDWANGQYYTLYFLQSPDESFEGKFFTQTFTKP